MKPSEITRFVSELRDALEPTIEQRVAEAVREIPYRVREEMERLVREEMRSIIREHILDSVTVTVKVTPEML